MGLIRRFSFQGSANWKPCRIFSLETAIRPCNIGNEDCGTESDNDMRVDIQRNDDSTSHMSMDPRSLDESDGCMY